MNTTTHTAIQSERNQKTWRDQLLLLAAGGIVSVAVAASISFGGRVMVGGETSAVLNSQVVSIREDSKDQRELLQKLLEKTSNLYSRSEAQADREAAERRSQSMEGRISELGRRIEALESNNRFLQQQMQMLPDRGQVNRK